MFAVAGYLAGYYDLNLRPFVPWFTPAVAWFSVSKHMRKFFRFAWFWWASGLFVISFGFIVSTSILAGANAFLWMLILVFEAAVFAGIVEFISSKLSGSFEDT
jgi:hypothetical protein